MAFKPCHIITNDTFLRFKLAATIGYELGTEDYTEDEGVHWHFHVHWPVGDTGTLSPTRSGALRRWRRENPNRPTFRKEDGCSCYNKAYGAKCGECGIFYKIIWTQTPEHHNNVHKYITDKWIDHPEWQVPPVE